MPGDWDWEICQDDEPDWACNEIGGQIIWCFEKNRGSKC